MTFGAECRNQIRQGDLIQNNCKVSNNVHLTVFRLFPAKNKVVDGVFVQFCNNLVGNNLVAVFIHKTKGIYDGWNSAKFDLFQSAVYTCVTLFVHVCVEVLKQWRIQQLFWHNHAKCNGVAIGILAGYVVVRKEIPHRVQLLVGNVARLVVVQIQDVVVGL